MCVLIFVYASACSLDLPLSGSRKQTRNGNTRSNMCQDYIPVTETVEHIEIALIFGVTISPVGSGP